MPAGDLSELEAVVAEGGTASEIDAVLAPLSSGADPSAITPMLLLLSEAGDQDDMWSILHTAEAFERSAYIAGLLRALPDLTRSCPWWASTVGVRILNSGADRAELVRQLRKAAASTKAATAVICGKINQDVRFHAKTAPVLAAAES